MDKPVRRLPRRPPRPFRLPRAAWILPNTHTARFTLCATAILFAMSLALLGSVGEMNTACPGISCTTFAVSEGAQAFFGDSEDAGMGHPLASHPAGSYAFFRCGAEEGEYGRMHLGWLWQGEYPSFQAGMNDHGLAYGLTAVPEVAMNAHPERRFVHGRDTFYDWILRHAATVDEAIQETLQFDFSSAWFQIQYADASGDSAVLSPAGDGEWAITRCAADEPALVASTFNLAEPDLFIGLDSFTRHQAALVTLTEDAATGMLESRAIEALRAVSRQGAFALNQSYTMYSTLYNLTDRAATVFLLSRWEQPITLRLEDELQKGNHRIALRDALSSQEIESAVHHYNTTQIGGIVLTVGAALGLIALLAVLIF